MFKRILIGLSYLALAVVFVGVTVALVAVGRGYGYDFKNRRVVHNGLVIMGSYPSAADVKINGKDIDRRTPYRANLEANDYDFEVTKEGYRTWRKRLGIVASGVTWAQYILLLPLELKPQTVPTQGEVAKMTSTPDRKRLALLTKGVDAAVWVVGSDGREQIKVYALKPATPELPAEVVDELSLAEDGSRVLIKSNHGGKTSHLLVEVQRDGQVVNLTEQFGFSFPDLKFNPSNWRELYWLSPEGLRRLDAEARTATLLVPGVIKGYAFGGERIFYIQKSETGVSVWSLDRGGHKQELVQSVADSDTYEMAYSGFQGQNFLAVAPRTTNTVTVYKDIFSNTPEAQVVTKLASRIRFNEDGRYLAFFWEQAFGTYDLEKDVIHETVKLDGALGYLAWFDNYHLLINSGGKLILVEYDGANKVEIDGQVAAGAPAFGGVEGKRLLWQGFRDGQERLMLLDVKR
jgi:hypothetical protein